MHEERWYGFIGPRDWIEDTTKPIYHLMDEPFVSNYAENHPDTIVFVLEDTQ